MYKPDAPILTEDEALFIGENFRRTAWQAFVFILPFLRRHLGRLILVCLADIAIILLNFIPPWFGTYLIDRAFPQRDWRLAMFIISLMLATTLTVQVTTAIRKFIYSYVEIRIPLDLRAQIYRHIQKFRLDTIEATPVGEYLFRLAVDTDRVAHTIYRILPTATMLFQFALILAFSTYADPIITLFVVLFIIPWTLLFYWVTSISRVLDRRRLRLAEIRDSGIQQATSSFSLIKSFSNERLELHKNVVRAGAAQRVAVHGYLFLVPFELITQKILPYARQTTVFVYLAQKVVMGEMTLGMTVPLMSYLNRLNYPIERMVNFFNWVRQTMISVERIMHVLQTEPSIKDKPNALRISTLTGLVEVSGVTFSRPSLALKDINLKLEPGKKVAVVGPSGAGKSTLVSLLLRTNLPQSGHILIDGHDLSDLHLESYLRNIGIVMQDTFLFGGTLAENLRFVRPEANDEAILSVLSDVGLSDWVASLPTGLNEDLQSGSQLSVGQRQRIGIARALLLNPSLLILDEPTSALDASSEAEVMALLNKVGTDRAVLLVTHRLDTVINADEILVLNHGEIAERGSHEYLMLKMGLYSEMQRVYRQREKVPA